MADFRIAHLTLGQTDVEAACAQFSTGVISIELIMKRSAGEERGITVFLALRPATRINAPAIADDQDDGL